MTLKQLREKKQKTQKHMADAIGISESYYCLLENGKRNISLKLAGAIAKELDVTIDHIFLLTNFAKRKDSDIA